MDKTIIRNIIKISGLILVIWLVWIIACQRGNFKALTPAALRDYIQSFGNWAAVIYILAYALNTISVFPPIAALSLTAGFVFGKTWGAVFLMAGAILGTSATFLISRLFGRALVESLMRDKFKTFDDLLERKGFAAILFFRVIPLVPYEVLNYASGLAKIKFRDYFLATFLGLIPGVLISAFLGGTLGEAKGFRDLISFKFILTLAALMILILIPVIYQRLKRKGVIHDR